MQDIDLEDVLAAEQSDMCSIGDFYEKQVNSIAAFLVYLVSCIM